MEHGRKVNFLLACSARVDPTQQALHVHGAIDWEPFSVDLLEVCPLPLLRLQAVRILLGRLTELALLLGKSASCLLHLCLGLLKSQNVELALILQPVNFLFEQGDGLLQFLAVAVPVLVLLDLLELREVERRDAKFQSGVFLLGLGKGFYTFLQVRWLQGV